MVLGTLIARIGVDTSGMVKAEKTVKASTEKMETSFKKTAKAGNTVRDMILGLGLAAVGYKLTGFTKDLVMAASDFEESAAKFGTVFRGVKGTGDWIQDLTQNFLMSNTEAQKYMGTMQDLFVPMGMARQEAANLSYEVVKLAADLGSFNNVATTDIMENMSSAFAKQYEVMRKYGINLSAATVEQKALKMGMAATKGELTDANKVMATYAIMLENSSDAVGDIDRTMDGFANTLKRAGARWGDLQVAMGTQLLPAGTEGLEYITFFIEGLGDIQIAMADLGGMISLELNDIAFEFESAGATLGLAWDKTIDGMKGAWESFAGFVADTSDFITGTGDQFGAGWSKEDGDAELESFMEMQARMKAEHEKRQDEQREHNAIMLQIAMDEKKSKWDPKLDVATAEDMRGKQAEKSAAALKKEATAAAKVAKKRTEMLTDLKDEANELTMQELDYKLWALGEETKAYEKTYANDAEMMEAWNQTMTARVREVTDERAEIIQGLHDKTEALTLSSEEAQLRSLQREDAAFREQYAGKEEVLTAWSALYDAKADEIAGNTIWEDLGEASMDWANSMSGAFVDMMTGAEISFEGILDSFLAMIAQMLIQKQVIEPLFDMMGGLGGGIMGLFSGTPQPGAKDFIGPMPQFAKGGLFSGSGISAYSNSIVSSPTAFMFAKGSMGIMGEAGREAIMPTSDGKNIGAMLNGRQTDVPLTRLPNGDLGVDIFSGKQTDIASGYAGFPMESMAPGKEGAGGRGINQNVNIYTPEGSETRTEPSEDGEGTNVIIEMIENGIIGRMSRGAGMAPFFNSKYRKVI